MAETAKAHARRVREGFFERYVKGRVIDIGPGSKPSDPITPDAELWDSALGNGDATFMEGIPDGAFGTVYSSHCLEHLDDPVKAIQNWFRILKAGGCLIISVPSKRLYEKKDRLPSRWNEDHRFFYNLVGNELDTRSFLDDILNAIDGTDADLLKLSVEDSGWVDTGPEAHSVGEYSLEAVIRKPEPKCMKLAVFTIVLNGMPWLPVIFTVLNSLKLDWHWYVVEGAALNVKCSTHCQPIEPQLSSDGTKEFLNGLINHPRVSIARKELWQGKVDMVNEAVSQIKDHCVLMQMDSDEIWSAENVSKVFSLLATKQPGSAAQFYCRYFVGPHLFTNSKDTYGNYAHDWVRAWRFSPGQKFITHCPPALEDQHIVFNRDQTMQVGIEFQHYSWVTETQVRFKCSFYNYGSGEGWNRLQSCTTLPVRLSDFLSWADCGSIVNTV